MATTPQTEEQKRTALSRWLKRRFVEWQNEKGEPRTQEQLAEELGVDSGTLGHWMRGRNLPKGENVHKLARLGGEVYEILGEPSTDSLLQRIIGRWPVIPDILKNKWASDIEEITDAGEDAGSKNGARRS